MREALLSALAVAYPFHYEIQGPGGIVNLSLGDGVVALVVAGFCCSLLWDRLSLPRYIIPTLAFMLVAVASLLYPWARPGPSAFYDPLPGILEIVKVAGNAAWMVTVYVLLRRNVVTGMKTFSMVSVIAASLFAIGTIYASLMHQGTRPSGPFENENLYANYLTLNVFLAMMLARLQEHAAVTPGARVPVWLMIPVLLVGVLATGSRGALIGAAVAYPLVVFGWHRPSRPSWQRIAGAIVIIGLSAYGLIAFWHANSFIALRVSTILSGQGPNIGERQHLWEMAIEAFSTSPLIGIGYHQFPQYAAAVHGWKLTVVHNTYLAMAAELGGVGLAAFAWLLLAVIRDAARIGRRREPPLGGVIVAIVVATLAQGLFADVEHYRSLWIAMGMLAAIDYAFTRP